MGITVRHCLIRLLRRSVESQRHVRLVGFGIRHLSVSAIDRGGGCHQQVIDLKFACAFENVEAAHQIGIEIGARVFEAVTHTRLAREVDDHLRPLRLAQRTEQRCVLQLAFDRVEMRVLKQHLVPPVLERHVIIIRHAVESYDAKPVTQQQVSEVIADETR